VTSSISTTRCSRSCAGRAQQLARELHRVRYFEGAELDSLLACAGLELVELCPFLHPGREPTTEDWSVSLVARRR